jgi:hypothetical protein
VVLETGLKRKVDIVLVQESPTDRRYQHPGFIFYWTEGRVMAAVRIDSIWNVTQNSKLAEGSKGDVQILTASIKGQKSVRLVNVYSQKVIERPAELVSWDRIITGRGGHTIICGDFNAHSPRWNPHCTERRNADFLESIIDQYELTVLNDETTTCSTPRSNLHSIIDLDFDNGRSSQVYEMEST